MLLALSKLIQEVYQKNNDNKVILIGHSMGGVVIESYVKQRGDSLVHKVITLGTPYNGLGGLALGSFHQGSTFNMERIINGGIFRGFLGANPLTYSTLPYHPAEYLPKVVATVLDASDEHVCEHFLIEK